MTLQKAVFFAGIAGYAATLLATLAVLIGVLINILGLARIDVTVGAWVIAACFGFRVICALWLKWLGGAPAEFRTK